MYSTAKRRRRHGDDESQEEREDALYRELGCKRLSLRSRCFSPSAICISLSSLSTHEANSRDDRKYQNGFVLFFLLV